MTSQVRFYSAEEVHAALGLEALADAIADALRGNVIAPLRHVHSVSPSASLLLMPAWNASPGGDIGVKLVTVFPENSATPTVNAVYVLFDGATGEPRAIIDGEALTLRRTAAASLLAARYLARNDARNVLIVGTGKLAPFMAHAHCSGRAVQRLMIWGRNADKARSLTQQLRTEALPAEVAPDLRLAVKQSHIVSCVTTATAPVVYGAWLAPGTHVDLVGAFKRHMREVDDEAVLRSRVYVDTYAGALSEASDVIEPIERGVIQRAGVRAELSELVSGAVAGRRDSEEITLFKSVGTAIEDLAAARMLITARVTPVSADK